MVYEPKEATAATAQANRDAVALYAMDDRQDFQDADRGFIAPFPGQVVGDDGHVIFDPNSFAYITDDAPTPDTVNPVCGGSRRCSGAVGCSRSSTGCTRCATTTSAI